MTCVTSLSPEESGLWQRASELWELARNAETAAITQALHPDYMGWDLNSTQPHDRKAAVRSVGSDAPRLLDYCLEPLSVRVYAGHTGVVHYRYRAMVQPRDGAPLAVCGQWSEVYVKGDTGWVMVSVCGRPQTA